MDEAQFVQTFRQLFFNLSVTGMEDGEEAWGENKVKRNWNMKHKQIPCIFPVRISLSSPVIQL